MYNLLYTVQEEILAREIFGEIARLKHLANFTLINSGCVIRIYFVGVLNIGEKLNKSPIAKIKSSPINLPVRYYTVYYTGTLPTTFEPNYIHKRVPYNLLYCILYIPV